MKSVIVMSLGGSLIIPKEVDFQFLKKFKSTILSNTKKHNFVIVCGGGLIARKYISALKSQSKSLKEQAYAGIRATRMNAKLMMQLFGDPANSTLPKSKSDIKAQLSKNSVVFCGALRYAEKETSDGTGAKLSEYFKTDFINMSNVSGLYTSNPATYKNAKFIRKISWEDFEKTTHKRKFKLGQHFVLDHNAATVIRKHKIKTYLIGKSPKNLSNLINNKPFRGTIIEG